MSEKQSLLMVPLESYKQRYTELLRRWEEKAFSTSFDLEFMDVEEPSVTLNIMGGEVLDMIQRPTHALQQTLQLLKKPELGKVWFSDFYHPGLDALSYSRKSMQAFSFCWAQTFDQFDFTREHHVEWMRPWEIMAFSIYSAVFVADDLLRDLIVTVSPSLADKIYVVGLPFDQHSVSMVSPSAMTRTDKEIDVVYSSRMDKEKNPSFFLDLVEQCPDLNFAICTGWPELKGSDLAAVNRAKRLNERGRLMVYSNLSKETYYHYLGQSKIQFNCAYQDWVSFTLLEALTYGCMPLYPMERSFPRALLHQGEYLYVPRALENAEQKLRTLLDDPPEDFSLLRKEILNYHSESLSRISTIIHGY